MEYIFSFSSRNSALKFADAVNSMGGKTKLVNAPINHAGCGLAVKCSDYNLCQNVLNCGHYAALRDIFSFDGQTYKMLYSTVN